MTLSSGKKDTKPFLPIRAKNPKLVLYTFPSFTFLKTHVLPHKRRKPHPLPQKPSTGWPPRPPPPNVATPTRHQPSDLACRHYLHCYRHRRHHRWDHCFHRIHRNPTKSPVHQHHVHPPWCVRLRPVRVTYDAGNYCYQVGERQQKGPCKFLWCKFHSRLPRYRDSKIGRGAVRRAQE